MPISAATLKNFVPATPATAGGTQEGLFARLLAAMIESRRRRAEAFLAEHRPFLEELAARRQD